MSQASTDLQLAPATAIDAAQQATTINCAFEGYLAGSIHLTPEGFGRFVHQQGISLEDSLLALDGERVAGFAYAGPHGVRCRLAGLGVAPAYRRRGVAAGLLDAFLHKARAEGYALAALEVFEQNVQALPLYRRLGFSSLRRLYGYTLHAPDLGPVGDSVREVSLQEAALWLAYEGEEANLPYQVSGEALARLGGAYRAYRRGRALVVLADYKERVWLRVVVDFGPAFAEGRALMRTLLRRFGGRKWVMREFLPEEMGQGVLAPLGFERSALNQLQMERSLQV